MQTPGLHHVAMTITDTERSRAFYEDLLGFQLTVFEISADTKAFFFSIGGVSFYFIPTQKPIEGDRFSEFRVGLDHLSFTASSLEELQALGDKVLAAGVDTKGVEKHASGNYYMALRDPDNIQLEYWLP